VSVIPSRDTRILIQGITGREGRMFTAESRAYGALIEAGVTPGRGGTRVADVPVYDTVAAACSRHHLDAALITVPPDAAADAALEAVAARIPLVVITTERLPARDMARICERADEQGVRVIGPNSLGIIVPGETRIGAAGGEAAQARRSYSAGRVAVLSRSGGMMTEIAAMLTAAGIGQRVCISVGGDAMIGSTLANLYTALASDPGTDAVVVFGEPGGSQEEDLAAVLDGGASLPVVAFIAGRFMDRFQGVRFGHAGSIVHGVAGSPRVKEERLRAAGARVATRLDEIPQLVREAVVGWNARRPAAGAPQNGGPGVRPEPKPPGPRGHEARPPNRVGQDGCQQ
jgi:succinyl-CoA synthetase alpha subunit